MVRPSPTSTDMRHFQPIVLLHSAIVHRRQRQGRLVQVTPAPEGMHTAPGKTMLGTGVPNMPVCRCTVIATEEQHLACGCNSKNQQVTRRENGCPLNRPAAALRVHSPWPR